MASYKQQLENIKADVGRIASNLAKGLASQAEKDLVKAHDKIIDNYYKAHDPSSYNRKHNLYNSLINHDVEKRNRSVKNKSYAASIVIGSFNMKDVYRTSVDTVFDLVWNKGIRGLPQYGDSPLNKSWVNPITGNYYSYNGEKWVNPYWDTNKYHNIFVTSVTIGSYVSKVDIPNNVMEDIVKHWWQANGETTCTKLIKKIKQ